MIPAPSGMGGRRAIGSECRWLSACRFVAMGAVLMTALTSLPPATLRAQEPPNDPPAVEGVSTGRAVAQVTLGTVGTIGGFVGGGLATRWVARRSGASEERASKLAYIGAWTGAALATPLAPALLGSQGDVHGSYPAALAGTLVGGAASMAIIAAGRRGAFDCDWCAPVRLLAGVSAFVLPSLGATIAFNNSRERH